MKLLFRYVKKGHVPDSGTIQGPFTPGLSRWHGAIGLKRGHQLCIRWYINIFMAYRGRGHKCLKSEWKKILLWNRSFCKNMSMCIKKHNFGPSFKKKKWSDFSWKKSKSWWIPSSQTTAFRERPFNIYRRGGGRDLVGGAFFWDQGGGLIFIQNLKGVDFFSCLTGKHFNKCYKKSVFMKNIWARWGLKSSALRGGGGWGGGFFRVHKCFFQLLLKCFRPPPSASIKRLLP